MSSTERINKLYTITLHQNDQKVYEENMPFMFNEPNEEDIKGFMKLIRPYLEFNKIEWHYLRQLKQIEL